MCSCTYIQTYIIDTCTRIVIRTYIQKYLIDTYISVFLRTFVRVSVNNTYIYTLVCMFVQVIIIDTLHIYFLTTCSILLSNNLHHNFINQSNTTSSLALFRAFFKHNISFRSFFDPSFNTTSFVSPLQA